MIVQSLADRGAQGRGNRTNGSAFPPDLVPSRLESHCAVKASSLLRLVIEDLYPGRVALVSSFGADAAALLRMVSQIDKATPVVFVDTGQHFPETLAYRDELCAFLGLTNVIIAEPKAETMAQEDPEKLLFMSDPDRCCNIRKVRPLAAAIEVYDAWITGRKGIDRLDLYGFHEALRLGVVVRIAAPAHRADEAVDDQQVAIAFRCILRAAVGMMHAAPAAAFVA
jgi:Phosphoadenosine phosphosulfate reductase family